MHKPIIIFVLLISCLDVYATRIAVLNDINGSFGKAGYDSRVHEGVRNILLQKVDLIISPGDMVAGQDIRQVLSADDLNGLWKSFSLDIHQKFKEASIPFAPAPGNHDASGYLPREMAIYKNYFLKKENIPNLNFIDKEKYPFYYSYLHEEVFFIALDDTIVNQLTENPTKNGLTQREWIKKQLESPISKKAKARIVYGHVPLYSVLSPKSHSRKSQEILNDEQFLKEKKNNLEEILSKGKVDLTVFAHSHAYYPGFIKQTALDFGLHVLFSPCLGSGNRYLKGESSKRSQHGYTIIEVNGEKGIFYQSFTYEGKLINSGLLPKEIHTDKVIIKRDDLLTK